jgi:hypothetical protein
MSALTLPPPINHDGSQADSHGQDINGSYDSASVKKTSEELLKGIIYPSREIRGEPTTCLEMDVRADFEIYI